ncbi:MAG: diguanylate cyclase [Gallionella sp.]|jgi:diguanylate cyclase (GGDEF)-like protein
MITSAEILHGKVLIVDDHEANVLLLQQMLQGAGYTSIATTINSGEVYKLHQDNHYDLILLDLLMPGMDGFQVMEALKKIEPDGYLPVLVITAQPDHKLRALKSGAKDFISKPFNLAEVLARVHNMLEVRLLYTQLEASNKTLESLALHDALTGLANRRLLMDRLSLSIVQARRRHGMMAVMYLDLDGFKQINDTLGHPAGDTLLSMVAARIVAAVRQEDTVARLGGDEFVIALWELSHGDDVAKLASKIIQSVSQPYSIQEHSVHITASIGVSVYPAHGDKAETLMKSADMALYDAKHAGKNNFHIATCTAPQAATCN